MSWISKIFGGAGRPADNPPAAENDHWPDEDQVAAPETAELFEDQLLRKAWAEQVLAGRGIAINPGLPCIESLSEVSLRSPRQVAERLLALTVVAVKGEGLDHDRVIALVGESDGWKLFSPRELAFLHNPSPSDHDRMQFVWRYEAAWVLFWALKFMEGPLDYPAQVCDVPLLMATVRETPDLAMHGMQPGNAILNEADLIYRYHWAIRQSVIDGAATPGGLDPGVVMERHYALNWLIGYRDQDWDDILTDT